MADGKLDQSVAPDEDTSKLKADVAAKFHEALNLPQAKTEPAAVAHIELTGLTGLKGLVGQAGSTGEKPDTTLRSLSDNIAQAKAKTTDSGNVLDNLARDSKVARYGMASVEGLAYAVPGVLKAVAKDVSNPLELAAKLGVAASIGVVMKTVLPRAGVGKAIVGTVMAGYMIKDALHPIMNAMDHLETSSNDMASVH